MADEQEPRRSGRATKGKHTRNTDLEEPTPPPPKKAISNVSSGRKKKQKATSQTPEESNDATDAEDGEVVQCPCGATTDDGGRQMIQCEGCEIWEHSSCMGIPTKEVPEHYFCENCKPELHQVLLKKIEKGETRWQKKQQQQQQQHQEQPRRSSGRASIGRRRRGDDDNDGSVTSSHQNEEQTRVEQSPEPSEDKDQNDISIDMEKSEADPAEPVEEKESEDTVPEASTAQEDGTKVEEEEEAPADDQDIKNEDMNDVPQPEQEDDSKTEVNDIEPLTTTDDVKDEEAEEIRNESPKKEIIKPPPLKTSNSNAADASKTAKVPKTPKTPITPVGPNRKRKADDSGEESSVAKEAKDASGRRSSLVQQSPKPKESTKARRQSAVKPAPKRAKSTVAAQLELVEDPDQLLDESRQRGAKGLSKFFKGCLDDGAPLPESEPDAEKFATRLGLEIEHYTYMQLSAGSSEPNEEYRIKFRSILSNLKQNATLRQSVLTKDISTEQFAKLTSDQMATDEIMQTVQAALIESEKQATLISDASGPRIRRTHKGEEIVGGDTGMIGDSHASFIGNRYEAKEGKEGSEEHESRPPTPVLQDTEMTDEPGALSPRQNAAVISSKPLIVDTGKPGPHRRTSSNFDIQNVWSNIESPDVDRIPQRYSVSRPTQAGSYHNNVAKEDKDVDMLLQDIDAPTPEEGAETPPYSPKDYDELPHGIVWRGAFHMSRTSDFEGDAALIGGPDISNKVPFKQLIGETVNVTGRIRIDRAKEYLCALRQGSRSSGLLLFSVSPTTRYTDQGANAAQFGNLFQHFRERDRYGVVGDPKYAANKDMYVVAVDKDDEVPEFLRDTKFPPTPRQHNTLVLCIVYNKALETSDGQQQFTPQHQASATSANSNNSSATPQPPGRNAQTPVTLSRPDKFIQQSSANVNQPYAPPEPSTTWSQQQQQQQQQPQPYPPVQPYTARLQQQQSQQQQSPTPGPYQQPVYGGLIAGMPSQQFEHQYQPPGLQYETSSSTPMPLVPNSNNNNHHHNNSSSNNNTGNSGTNGIKQDMISHLMGTINLGPEDEEMLRKLLEKYPEAKNDPRLLIELIQQHQQQQQQQQGSSSSSRQGGGGVMI